MNELLLEKSRTEAAAPAPATRRAKQPAPHLHLPRACLGGEMAEQPFALQHSLVGHPLLSLTRLAQLVQELPRDLIEFNGGNAAIDQDPDTTPALDLVPVEVVRQIEQCGAWMVLKRVEKSAPYRALLDEALMSLARARGFHSLKEAGFTGIEGYIFVSSPHTTTPFHLDAEDNFFVQIHGEKVFHIFDNRDHSIADTRDIERAITRHRNLRFEESFDQRKVSFALGPGDGCFVPYLWPHWLRTGSSYSISMAITWKSEQARRTNELHFANSMLRKIGLAPRAPGVHPWGDAIKLAVFRAGLGLVEPLRSSERLRKILRRAALGPNANYYYGKG